MSKHLIKVFLLYVLLAANSSAAENSSHLNGSVPAKSSTLDIADTLTGEIVSNVSMPALKSATYNAATGVLSVTGTNFRSISGAKNDVVVKALTLRGQGFITYQLTSSSVEVTSTTAFSVTLNSADKTALEPLLNRAGTRSVDDALYILSAADNWIPGAEASTNIADATTEVSVSNLAAASVTLTANNSTIAEDSGTSTLTATVSRLLSANVTVNVALAYGGTAVTGTDYTGASSITVPSGQLTGTTTVSAVSDTVVEDTETIVIDISAVTASAGDEASENGVQQQTISITDDDSASVTLSANNGSISETGGSSTVTATLDKASFENVVVSLGYSGTATSTVDYATPSGSITIAAGQTTGTANITATADTSVEADETIIVDITGVSGGKASESNTQQQTVTITDDDSALVTLSVNNDSISETDGSSTVTATLDKASFENVLVSLGYTGTATSGVDYATSSASITIAAGETTGTATITATPDDSVEEDETIIVDITGVSGGKASESDSQQQTVTITDDDSPLVMLSVNNGSISETSGSSTVTATLDRASFENVVVTLGYTGTATSGVDYATPSASITITAGQTTGTATLSSTSDSVSEADETIIIDITGVSGGSASESGQQQQTVTIVDDDNSAPTIASLPTALTVTEDTTDNIDISAIVLADEQDNALVVTFTVDSGSVSSPLGTSGSVTVGNSGTASMTLSGSVANINSFLNNSNAVAITPSENSTTSITLTVTPNDGTLNGTSATSTVSVTPVNDNPTLNAGAGTFDMSGGSGFSTTTYTETEAGITMSATKDGGVWSSADFNNSFSASGNVILATLTNTNLITVSFDTAVDVESFVFFDNLNTIGGTFTFSVTSGTGTALTLTKTSFTDGSSNVLTPSDWTGVQAFTITHSIGDFSPIMDSIKFARTVSDATFTEDVAANVDLSSFTLSDVDSNAITVTLTASAGSFSTPVDGASVGAGVAETLISSTVITLVGSPGDITTYLDTTSAIQYTGAANANGNNVATIQVAANDGDGSGNLTLQTLNVDITAVNDAPDISGTPPTSINEDTAYSFTPGSSDVDNDTLTFSLTGQPGWLSVNSSTGALTGTPTNGDIGTASNIVLSVSDGTELVSLSPFNITIVNVNDAPVITQGDSMTITFGEDSSVGLTLGVTDVDSTVFTWSISSAPSNGIASASSSGGISYSPTANFFGSDSFTVSVSDGALTDTIFVNVSITAVNDLPEISGTPASSIDEDTAYSFTPVSSDVENDTLTFSLAGQPGWLAVNSATGALTGTPTNSDVGTASNIVLSISDGTASVSLPAFSVTVANVNDAPIIAQGASTTITLGEDSSISLPLAVTDVDSSTFTWSINSASSNGTSSVNSSGEVSYSPAANFFGSDSLTVSVSDGALSDTIAISVTVTAVNDAPVIGGAPGTSVVAGQSYSFTPSASDVDGDELTFSAQNLPAFMTLNSSTGLISGTPARSDVGTYSGVILSVSDGTDTASLAAFDLQVIDFNAAPVIVQGESTTVTMSEDGSPTPFALTLSATDANPDDTLTWSVGDASLGTVSVSNAGVVTYVPAVNVNGTDNFTVSVTDSIDSDSIAVAVTIEPVNDAPVISGEPLTAVNLDTAYSFVPDASDVENDTLTFSIENAPTWAAFSTSTGALTGTPTGNDVGVTESIVISVTDGAEIVSLAAFSITVVNPNVNVAPVVANIASTTDEDVAIEITLEGTDANGDTLTYTVTTEASAGSVNIVDNIATYTPNANANGEDSFAYMASDGVLDSEPATVTVTVTPVNDAPVILGQPAAQVSSDASYSFTPEASDVDNDTLTFSITNMPDWGQFNAETGSLTGTLAVSNVGIFDGIEISVTDGEASATLGPFSIEVVDAMLNNAPVASDQSVAVTEDTPIVITLEATDADGDVLAYTIEQAPTQGELVPGNVANQFTYTPTANVGGVSDAFLFSATDGVDVSNTATVTLTIAAVNDAPVIAGEALTSIRVNQAYSFIPSATDVENDTLTFTVANQPRWTSFDANTGALTGTPGSADVATYGNVTITVSDGNSDTALAAFNIEVLANNTPVISGSSLSRIEVGSNYSFSPSATDSDGDALSFSIINQPAWASFDGQSGTLSGTPTTADVGTTSAIAISVSDGIDTVTLTPFDLDVCSVCGNVAPTINGLPSDNVIEGQAYTFTPTASDANNDVLTFSIINQPSWANFDVNTGALNGTPGAADIGISAGIIIRVTDGEFTDQLQPFSITVVEFNDAPVISGNPATSVFQDDRYRFTPSASDPDGDNLSFTIVNQPDWTSFNSRTGTLQGNPRRANIGVYSDIAISVTDGSISVSLPSFSIDVAARNTAPVISGSPRTGITQGVTYSFIPDASDADGDALTFSATGLPAWLAIDNTSGALSGTPQNSDVGSTGDIIISVTDGQDSSSLTAFSIIVTASNSAPVANNGAFDVAEDGVIIISASVNDADGDSVTLDIQQQAQNGVLTQLDTGWIYSPNPDFTGDDSFVYVANDGVSASEPGTITIAVTSVNDAPDAVNDTLAVDQNESGTYVLDVLANDTDVDITTAIDSLSIQGAQASFGAVNIVNNQLSFTPGVSFIGDVTLVYAIRDIAGSGDQGIVSLTINGVAGVGAPVINVPADISVNATGLFTSVDLGVAEATDAEGNPLPVTLNGNNINFAPGAHTVYWQAEDSFGTTSTDSQNVNVNPLISLSKDQIVSEGSVVTVSVLLNGSAPSYPLTVNYTVGGTSDSADHNAVNSSVTFAQGTEQLITFDVLNDDVVETNETIIFVLETGINRGANNVSTITISEANIAPEIQLTVAQSNQERLTVAQDEGEVTITGLVTDANPTDTVTVQWTGIGLSDLSSSNDTFVFDPALVAPGIYQVSLFAFDDALPLLTNISDVFIEVVDTLEVLSDIVDTDGDLIPDSQEGFTDSDGDGIPDYLDAINDCNVVPEQASTQDGFLVESEPGVCMRTGSISGLNASNGLEVLPGTGTGGRQAAGTLKGINSRGELVNIVVDGLPQDTIATNIGGIFDYILYDLPEEGQVASIVIPQTTPIPGNAVYRQYKQSADAWVDFIIDDNNQIFSIAGERGICPPPGDASWVAGLSEGAWCVQLQILDGGLNDDDGEVNGAVSDTSGVAVILNNNQLPVAVDDAVSMQWNTFTEIDVLANDTDGDGDALQVVNIVGNFGTSEIDSDNRVLYTPSSGYVGTDTLVYAVSDGSGGTASAEVIVTIVGNRAPGAVADSASTDDKTTIEIDVLANDIDVDGDALSVQSASAETGIVTISDNNTLIYTPQSGFDGLDTITYVVVDTFDATDSSVVSVMVDGNKAPVAENDSVTTTFETAVIVNVLNNDSDVNNDGLTVVEASTGNGQVLINNDGTLTFTPAAGFSGTTTIDYTISDGVLTASAVVTVTVQAQPVEVVTVTNKSQGNGGAIGALALFLMLMIGWRRRQWLIATIQGK